MKSIFRAHIFIGVSHGADREATKENTARTAQNIYNHLEFNILSGATVGTEEKVVVICFILQYG